MKTKLGIIGLIAVAVALGAAGALAFTGSSEKPIQYITAPATYGDLESTVMATGTLEPSNIVDVGAQTSGQLQSLDVKVGDLVTKGQKVGQIDPTLLNNSLRSAQTNITTFASIRASSQAQFGVAQAEVSRQRALAAQGVAAPSAVEKADAALKSASASVTSMEAQAANAQLNLEAAQANLEKANVRAPIDGIVAEILINAGASVNTNNQVPVIFRVAKMDMMTVRAQISEADVLKMTEGQAVYFTVMGEPDTRYDAKLRSLGYTPSSGQLDPSKGGAIKTAIYYNAMLDLPNKDGRLRPGMTAVVHVVLGQARHALTIPAAALGDRIDKQRYMVQVRDAKGQVSRRQVTIGLNDQLNVEVKDGLKAGDRVVIGEIAPNRSGGEPSRLQLPSSLKG